MHYLWPDLPLPLGNVPSTGPEAISDDSHDRSRHGIGAGAAYLSAVRLVSRKLVLDSKSRLK